MKSTDLPIAKGKASSELKTTKTYELWLLAPVSAAAPYPHPQDNTAAPLLRPGAAQPQWLCCWSWKRKRIPWEGLRACLCQVLLPSPKRWQLPTRQNNSLKSKHGAWGEITAGWWRRSPSSSSIPLICQPSAREAAAVLHHPGCSSAGKHVAK